MNLNSARIFFIAQVLALALSSGQAWGGLFGGADFAPVIAESDKNKAGIDLLDDAVSGNSSCRVDGFGLGNAKKLFDKIRSSAIDAQADVSMSTAELKSKADKCGTTQAEQDTCIAAAAASGSTVEAKKCNSAKIILGELAPCFKWEYQAPSSVPSEAAAPDCSTVKTALDAVKNICKQIRSSLDRICVQSSAIGGDMSGNAMQALSLLKGLTSANQSANPSKGSGVSTVTSTTIPNVSLADGSGASTPGASGAKTQTAASKQSSSDSTGASTNFGGSGGYSSGPKLDYGASTMAPKSAKSESGGGGGGNMTGASSAGSSAKGAEGAQLAASTGTPEYGGGSGGGGSGGSKRPALGLKADGSLLDSILGKDKAAAGRGLASTGDGVSGNNNADGAKPQISGMGINLFNVVGEKIREYKNIKHLLL